MARNKRDSPSFSLSTFVRNIFQLRRRVIRSSKNCSRDLVKPRQSHRKSGKSEPPLPLCRPMQNPSSVPGDERGKRIEIDRSRRRNDSSIQPCSRPLSRLHFRASTSAPFARQTFPPSVVPLCRTPRGKRDARTPRKKSLPPSLLALCSPFSTRRLDLDWITV